MGLMTWDIYIDGRGRPIQKKQTCNEGRCSSTICQEGILLGGKKARSLSVGHSGRRRVRAEERSSSGVGECSQTAWPRRAQVTRSWRSWLRGERDVLTLCHRCESLIGLADNSISDRIAFLNEILTKKKTVVMESLWVKQPCQVVVAREGRIGQSQAGIPYLKKIFKTM